MFVAANAKSASTQKGLVSERMSTTQTPAKTEWPTVLVGILILCGYAAITKFHRSLPVPVFLVGLAWFSAWWSSFQHELLHGHPFPHAIINNTIGLLSFVFWVPYESYKELHLRHHRDEWLTDPFEDPESYYLDGPRWATMAPWRQRIRWVNRTLLGRLIIGPWLSVSSFLLQEAKKVREDALGARRSWTRHLAVAIPVAAWVFIVCDIPAWQYGLAGVWGATSLMKLRSFAEHRWEPDDLCRTAMIHAGLPFSLLYLNNNLHHTHHARPGTPWYKLPAASVALGSDEVSRPGAGVYKGYIDVARLYLVRPLCLPVHPPAKEAAPLVSARVDRLDRLDRLAQG